jgi:hypothetical protein
LTSICIWKCPLICAALLNCLLWSNANYFSEKWGDPDCLRGHILLNCFSKQLSLKIMSIWHFCPSGQECLSWEVQKVRFCPQRRGSNTFNRSEVSANVTFLAKLSNKEIYFKKWLLGWPYINLIVP